jgi:hypothetical protein
MRRLLIAMTLVALVLTMSESVASYARTNVSFLRIIRVTQAPYQPVAFRVWVKAPVNHRILVAIKIFDNAGSTVYTATQSSPLEASYSQPYYSTTLTLKWRKVSDDGFRLPRGQGFIAVAFASDIDAGQKLFRSSPYRFTLST